MDQIIVLDSSMFWIISVIVIGTTIWVAYDASANKVPVELNKPYSLNNGAVAWFLSCLLFWIVAFPLYLVRRSQTFGGKSVTASSPDEELRKLKRLFDDGVITENDFEAKKKELLSKL